MSIQSPTTSHTGTGTGSPRIDTHSSRVDVINTKHGRILCVADVRGALSSLNTLAAEHNAIAIIHSGDFGFYEPSSIPSISDRTLKHLLQYSSLLTPQFRSQLLSPSTSPLQLRQLLQNHPEFVLSEFPKLLNGELKFNVPVYTVWGACEDVAILEKIRLAPHSTLSIPDSTPSLAPSTTTQPSSSSSEVPSSYSIPNLTVLDEATTRVLVIGGVRLRLFGLGGAVVSHKLFDNGQGNATIAGGMGTMWTTMLQIGELVDTAQKVYDPSETRLLLTHASPGREGLISQLSLVLKADLTISAGLHFRYGVSYNEFSVNWDPESFRGKLEASRKAFGEVWDAVKNQVEGVVDENQKSLLANALAVANRVPATAPVAGGPAAEETAWKNCWNWNLPDAAFGSLVLDIREGRIGSEMKSQGFNFAYRSSSSSSQPSTSASRPTQPHPQSQSQQSSAPPAPQPQQNLNRPQPVAAAPPTSTSTAPHTVQGVGRGGPHQRGSSGAMRAGGNRIGFSNYQAPPSSTSTAEPESAPPPPPPSTEPKQTNGTPSSESKPSQPSPVASPAPPTSNSVAPPTGPRIPQNRPPSRQQQNPSPAPPQSSSPAPPTTQPESSSSETPAKPSSDPSSQAIETPGENQSAENTTGSIGRSSGRGRGRGGRGRGDGVDRGERSERGGATPGRGNRGRSNGEWRGRGRGGARQASGEVGNTTPSAVGGNGGGGGGGEKPSA